MPVTPLKEDTYKVERFSALTARFIQEKLWRYWNDLYIKWKDGKLTDEDFYKGYADFSIDMRNKLREIGEVDHITKLKQVVHFG
jgi:hypothetical protein